MHLTPDARSHLVTEAFEAHYRHLAGLAYRVLGDRDEAQEVAADALVRLSDHAVAGRPAAERLAWLRRVTMNAALNRLRARQRAVARQDRAGRLDHPLTSADAAAASPLAAAVDSETRDEVRDVLAGLPPRQASCLLLAHAGLTHAEIAAALGIARGSVGVLRARGEDAFRRSWTARFGSGPRVSDGHTADSPIRSAGEHP